MDPSLQGEYISPAFFLENLGIAKLLTLLVCHSPYASSTATETKDC